MANDTTQARTTVTMAVEGMTCGNCVRHIGEALEKHFTDLTHSIDLEGGTLTVTFDPTQLKLADIAAVVAEEGYPVTAG
ncbi:MAG: heavy-metal-associated domain-containing protein [Candidatus Sericytochromatia bacterium]|nr:heavy-metal-associated domain-containing protein [Candidatus Sericytochromatia bacterium]